jgi:phosphoglycerate dehydrogenase-like enzyme
MKVQITTRITDEHLETLRRVSPRLEVVQELDGERARQRFRDAEILCCYQLPAPLEEAGGLKWIQLTSAGSEHLFEAGIQARDILVTTVKGIHGPAIAEYVLWAMMTLSRGLLPVLRETERRQWRPRRQRAYYQPLVRGKTLGIVGLGHVGREVASAARGLGVRVIGLRRSAPAEGEPDLVEETYPRDRLLQMLPRCDFVVLIVPLTAATRQMFGEQELRAMSPDSHLINVARGEVVDEEAPARALREGWIAGAALDVFTQEPLPAESDLWGLPNVLITPHMAGGFSAYSDRVVEIFRDNLRRYLAGEPLHNLLDKSQGY